MRFTKISMGFLWFGKKREIEQVREETRRSFDKVKQDHSKISRWIGHFKEKHDDHDASFSVLNAKIDQISQDIDDIKSFISFFDTSLARRIPQQSKQPFNKRTAVQGVQTPVQTAVQTPYAYLFLKNLTMMERAVLWILLNTELKLSYEDIATILGKDKSTVKVQMNNIKQKNENLISEAIEKTGKKRYFIEQDLKEHLLKAAKLRTHRVKEKK